MSEISKTLPDEIAIAPPAALAKANQHRRSQRFIFLNADNEFSLLWLMRADYTCSSELEAEAGVADWFRRLTAAVPELISFNADINCGPHRAVNGFPVGAVKQFLHTVRKKLAGDLLESGALKLRIGRDRDQHITIEIDSCRDPDALAADSAALFSNLNGWLDNCTKTILSFRLTALSAHERLAIERDQTSQI
jgi:hypothetical protein